MRQTSNGTVRYVVVHERQPSNPSAPSRVSASVYQVLTTIHGYLELARRCRGRTQHTLCLPARLLPLSLSLSHTHTCHNTPMEYNHRAVAIRTGVAMIGRSNSTQTHVLATDKGSSLTHSITLVEIAIRNKTSPPTQPPTDVVSRGIQDVLSVPTTTPVCTVVFSGYKVYGTRARECKASLCCYYFSRCSRRVAWPSSVVMTGEPVRRMGTVRVLRYVRRSACRTKIGSVVCRARPLERASVQL